MHACLVHQRACANFEFSRGISEIFNGILGTVFMLIGGICPCLVGVYAQHPSDEQPLFPCVCVLLVCRRAKRARGWDNYLRR